MFLMLKVFKELSYESCYRLFRQKIFPLTDHNFTAFALFQIVLIHLSAFLIMYSEISFFATVQSLTQLSSSNVQFC